MVGAIVYMAPIIMGVRKMKFENTEVWGWDKAIKYMHNITGSKSDS